MNRQRLERLLIMAAEVTDVAPAAKPILDRIEAEYERACRGSETDRVRRLIEERRG
jgi:hypothetical protein